MAPNCDEPIYLVKVAKALGALIWRPIIFIIIIGRLMLLLRGVCLCVCDVWHIPQRNTNVVGCCGSEQQTKGS